MTKKFINYIFFIIFILASTISSSLYPEESSMTFLHQVHQQLDALINQTREINPISEPDWSSLLHEFTNDQEEIQTLFHDAQFAYLEAQEYLNSNDPETARHLLYRSSLIFDTLLDVKQGDKDLKILQRKMEETEQLISKCPDFDDQLIFLNEEQDQQLALLEKLLNPQKKVGANFSYNDFNSNPFMSAEERAAIKDYLLPINHPLKPILDSIFRVKRATLNSEAMDESGFTIKFKQPRSFIIVASHPQLPGYLLKLYLDSELRKKHGVPGWKWFVQRIQGATKILTIITARNSKYFVVPKKWMYPLPIHPAVPISPAFERKNEILVVQDMRLVSNENNLEAWKTVITKKHLHDFYAILKFAGGDSYRATNVAYTQDGTFAFIDTEYKTRHPNYYTIQRYLSAEMAHYWGQLVTKKR